jgi:hypothetical protein
MTDSIVSGLAASREERKKPSVDAMIAELEAMDAPAPAPSVTPQSTPNVQPKAPLQTAQAASSPGVMDEVGKAVVGGVRDGAVNTLQAFQDMGQWVNDNLIDLRIAKKNATVNKLRDSIEKGTVLPSVAPNKTVAGNIGRSVFQFLPEFIAANKALAVGRLASATKAATAGRAMAAGAVADATAFDPHEKRVSNMVMELTDNHPIVGATVFNYLAADPSDSNGEGRFKNALEGLGLGLAADGLFKAVKATKHYFDAKGVNAAEAVQQAAKVEPTLNTEAVTPEVKPQVEAPDLAAQIDQIKGVKPKETPVAAPEVSPKEFKSNWNPSASGTDLKYTSKFVRNDGAGTSPSTTADIQPTTTIAGFPAVETKEGITVYDRYSAENFPKDVEVNAARAANGIQVTDLTGQYVPIGTFLKSGDNGIEHVVVSDAYRRRGIGTGLLKAAQASGVDVAKASEISPDGAALLNAYHSGPKAPELSGVTLEGDAATVDAIQQSLPEGFTVKETPLEEAAMKAEGPPTAAIDVPTQAAPVLDPMARVLADPKYASIAPGTRKALPRISSARVETMVQAAKNGTMKDLADSLDHKDFNFDRIDSPEDIQELMDATSKVFEAETSKVTGGTQSLAETQELADTLGTSMESLKELYGDTNNLAARVTANRVLLAASAKKTSELAQSAATGDSLALLAFRKQVALHASIQAQMKGVQTEVARALGAMRIESKAGNLVLNEVDDLLSNLGGKEVNLKFAKKVAEQTDPAKIAAMTRLSAMARTQDALYEAWVNGVLSGPTTHVVNAMGNSLVALLTVAEKGTAAAVGKIFRGGAADRVKLGEAQAQLFGMVEGLKDVFSITGEGLKAVRQATGEAVTGNFSAAKGTLKSAEDQFGGVYQSFANDTPILDNALYGTKEFDLQTPAISAQGLDLTGWQGSVADVLGAIIRTPGRVLTTTDEVFKTIHYRGELKAQAYRQAKSEGLEGEAFINRLGELVAARETPQGGDQLSMQALEAARRGTFTNSLGDVGKFMQYAASKIPGARYVFPFIRTPANIMNYTWERTPVLNVLNNQMREDFLAGGVRRDTAVAKTAIGGAFYIMAAQLAAEGKITGHLDKKSSAEKLGGQQAYSIKVGDTYYAYNRLDPIGMIFGLAADFSNLTGNIDDGRRSDISAAMITAISSNLLSKSYLSTASELFQIIGNVEQTERSTQFERFINRQTASFIPFSSLVRTVRRTDDTTVREVWDLMDTLKNSVPGYSKDLFPHRNVFGDPVVYGGGLGPDIASPIYTSKESDNPAANEIARLNIDLQLPARTIASGKGTQAIDLTHEQYDRYVALAGNEAKVFQGKGFKDYLTEFVQTPKYLEGSDDQGDYDGLKRLEIETLYASAKKVALYQLLDEFPDLKAKYMQNIKNRGNALKGAPVIPILTEAD